jgi:hypothetical protein
MNSKHAVHSTVASLFMSYISPPFQATYRLSNVAKILNDTMKDNFGAEYNRYFSRQPVRARYDMEQKKGGGCEGVARKPHTTPRHVKLTFIQFTCFLYRMSNKSAAGSNGKPHQSTDLHIVQAQF